ncbi:MAG: hypothetical protein NT072_00855 [Deltaproteobacteria bacterium]|nr:hypothetical protein [Deltaproteobacteria bacterium]
MENGFIHLCQPDGCKSCGACCGLYNYADSSRDALVIRLKRRTELWHDGMRDSARAAAFSETMKHLEPQEKLYEVIYCCEFLGFIDEEERRVGCLLHPAQNRDADLRDASFYGRELCDGHFCPSYHHLSREEKLALIEIIDDWYLFGLCVTDIDLVKEYFRLVSERIYQMPAPEAFRNYHLKEAAHRFFTLKVSWPFRSPETNRFGKYYFDGSQYMISHIDYERFGCGRSRFDRIFLSLTSRFDSASELARAEALIDEYIEEFARCWRQMY